MAQISPIPLLNVRNELIKRPDGGDWVPIIDKEAMKFLFWNLRGGNQETMQSIKGYIQEYKPVMLLLMDTRANSEKTATHIAGLCRMGYPNLHVTTPTVEHPQMRSLGTME